jgi:16S rRNA (cytidine1402-2'-O)-methyltransferase
MSAPDHTKKPPLKKELSQNSAKARPGLYLVASPIGNLRDISLRALDMLEGCDALICEDSRVSGGLLSAYGLKKELLIYNDHATDRQREAILQRLGQGQVLAMVSDAGTPLVSDPGYKLVRAALAEGLYVSALPGACAPVLALQLSGLPSDSFSFIGFLPHKTKARQDVLARWKNVPGTILAFETGPRLAESLADMRDVLGPRPAAVLREMTKLYEEGVRGDLGTLAAHYAEHGAPKGEIVVAIGGAPEMETSLGEVEPALKSALRLLGTKQASQLIAEIFGLPAKEVYSFALEIAQSGRS